VFIWNGLEGGGQRLYRPRGAQRGVPRFSFYVVSLPCTDPADCCRRGGPGIWPGIRSWWPRSEMGGLLANRVVTRQTILAQSSDKFLRAAASILGVIMVVVTASGYSRNANRPHRPGRSTPRTAWFSLLRARAASLGLVVALGFLLMVSLAASTALSALAITRGT